MNKFLLIVICALLLLTLADQLLVFNNAFIASSDEFAGMLAGVMLVGNGTFVYWKYYKLALVAGALLAVGVLMKIMHWPGADEMLFVSLPLVPAIYSVHFFSKRDKTILDILKWCTILFPFILAPMNFFHWVDLPMQVRKAPVYFYWFTFVFFVGTRLRDKTLFLH